MEVERRVWESPAFFLWLIRVRQFDVRGVVRAVFGDRILAYFKRRNGDRNAAVEVIFASAMNECYRLFPVPAGSTSIKTIAVEANIGVGTITSARLLFRAGFLMPHSLPMATYVQHPCRALVCHAASSSKRR